MSGIPSGTPRMAMKGSLSNREEMRFGFKNFSLIWGRPGVTELGG